MYCFGSYRYLEDWTFADVAFEARGNTLEELFQAALDATMNVMVSNLAAIGLKETLEERLEAGSEAELLHDFLQRALYLKDAKLILVRAERLKIERRSGAIHLSAILRGERLDPRKHELVADVKAVTHHRFEVRQEGETWIATAVLDV